MNHSLPLFVLFLIVLSQSVFAIGLGVSPAFLEYDAFSESDLEKELFVNNTESIPLDFLLYSDSDAVLPFPSTFSLRSGETKKVIIKLDAKKSSENFTTTLYVVSNTPTNTQVKTGIKLPVTVTIQNKSLLSNDNPPSRNRNTNLESTNSPRGKSIITENTTTPSQSSTLNLAGLFSLATGKDFLLIFLVAVLLVVIYVFFK